MSFALAMIAAPAAASPQRISLEALAGSWVFETEPHTITGCVIRGEVAATHVHDQLRMTMRANETCPHRDEVRAEEACVARLAREMLTVRCTLVSSTSNGYLADQFSLRALNSNLMTGRLADGGLWDHPVHWRRAAPPLVS